MSYSVKCPYCNHKNTFMEVPSWDDCDCEGCGKVFDIHKDITVELSATKKPACYFGEADHSWALILDKESTKAYSCKCGKTKWEGLQP